MNVSITVPEGYMQDHKGRLIPVAMIPPIDIARHEMVNELFGHAVETQAQMKKFKQFVLDTIAAFCEMSAEQYDLAVGGKKGNMTFMSFDGRCKIAVAVADALAFDERLQVAKTLIDECVQEWLVGSRPEISALINDAFQVDKAGNISTWRVLGLRRLNIDGEKWLQAMAALSDSVQVQSSKSYVRFYQRTADSERYEAVTLDFAAI